MSAVDAGGVATRDPDLVLARLHLRLGSLALARAELETLAGRDALDEAGLLDLAEARWRTGDIAGAGEAAVAALDEEEGPLLALVVAAEAAAARGRPTEARRLADKAMEAAAGSIDALFAGMPRAAVWPPDAAAPPPSPTTMFDPPRRAASPVHRHPRPHDSGMPAAAAAAAAAALASRPGRRAWRRRCRDDRPVGGRRLAGTGVAIGMAARVATDGAAGRRRRLADRRGGARPGSRRARRERSRRGRGPTGTGDPRRAGPGPGGPRPHRGPDGARHRPGPRRRLPPGRSRARGTPGVRRRGTWRPRRRRRRRSTANVHADHADHADHARSTPTQPTVDPTDSHPKETPRDRTHPRPHQARRRAAPADRADPRSVRGARPQGRRAQARPRRPRARGAPLRGPPREAVLRRAGRLHHVGAARRARPRRTERDRRRARDQRRDPPARGGARARSAATTRSRPPRTSSMPPTARRPRRVELALWFADAELFDYERDIDRWVLAPAE